MGFTSSPKIMGEFANGIFNKVILTLLSVVIVGINLFFVGSTVSTALPHSWWIYTLFESSDSFTCFLSVTSVFTLSSPWEATLIVSRLYPTTVITLLISSHTRRH